MAIRFRQRVSPRSITQESFHTDLAFRTFAANFGAFIETNPNAFATHSPQKETTNERFGASRLRTDPNEGQAALCTDRPSPEVQIAQPLDTAHNDSTNHANVMHMTRIHLFCFAIIATLAGWHCSSAPKHDAMEFFQPVYEACKQSPTDCTVDFAKLTNFEWDRMAFVKMQPANTEVAQALGINAIDRPEFEEWIVFLQKGEIVHHVARTYHPEMPLDHTIFLDFGDRQGQWMIFPKEKAVFNAVIKKGEGIVNIDLLPLEE